MPSNSAVASIAFCGSQPPDCSCARHSTGITADCWRPSGYLAICAFAQAKFSGVKEKLGGCFSARRRTLIGRPRRNSLPLKGGGSGRGSRAGSENMQSTHQPGRQRSLPRTFAKAVRPQTPTYPPPYRGRKSPADRAEKRSSVDLTKDDIDAAKNCRNVSQHVPP